MASSPELRGAGEVFRAFLRLGLTSFGGPVAHLGYFRETFVARRAWLTESAYAEVVALCQFLPGPTSSQVAMVIGLRRAGLLGLVAAWVAFTAPSVALMLVLARGVASISGTGGIVTGFKAAAVAVVALAVIEMARALAPDVRRASIALAALVVSLLAGWSAVQIAVIAGAGVVGLFWLRGLVAGGEDVDTAPPARVGRRLAWGALIVFAALLTVVPILHGGAGQLFAAFYRAGALTFGGGHVVLPLLQHGVVDSGLVSAGDFLAGYGVAQAMPGPLFSVAAYLGAVATSGPSGLAGAAIAVTAIFLPGALLVVAVLPWWSAVRHDHRARSALLGINAGVVGLLAAALWNPVIVDGIVSGASAIIAVAAFVALGRLRVPAWAVVIAAGVAGALLAG